MVGSSKQHTHVDEEAHVVPPAGRAVWDVCTVQSSFSSALARRVLLHVMCCNCMNNSPNSLSNTLKASVPQVRTRGADTPASPPWPPSLLPTERGPRLSWTRPDPFSAVSRPWESMRGYRAYTSTDHLRHLEHVTRTLGIRGSVAGRFRLDPEP